MSGIETAAEPGSVLIHFLSESRVGGFEEVGGAVPRSLRMEAPDRHLRGDHHHRE